MKSPAASVALAVALASCSEPPTRPRGGGTTGRLVIADSIEGVIALFSDPSTDPAAFARNVIAVHGGHLRFVFEHGTKGFSAVLPSRAVQTLRVHPAIKYVGPIGLVKAVDHQTQANASWGIDRIDQRALPLSGTYVYSGNGAGVTAYIIDHGILTTHSDFGGRASVEFDATGGNGQDCSGHGTHVAGTVGGTTYGVAKGVQLKAIRVIDCDPETPDSIDNVLEGIDSVIGNHASPAVANISLAAIVVINNVEHETTDVAFDTKVADLVAAGVPAVVAAGNQNKDACGVSPARVASAITVGATTSSDSRATFSNFGPCLDLFAPGQGITSAWWTSNTATRTDDGTSFAAPHVTGAAVLYLQRDPTATPAQVWSALNSRTTSGVLTNTGAGSPNKLLYTLFVEVTISGPGNIQQCGTYTWTALPLGVQSSGYTYLWEEYYHQIGQWFTNPETGPALTASMCAGDGSRTLRVTATNSFGFHATASKFVFAGL
jgi:subtilisin family serine protease